MRAAAVAACALLSCARGADPNLIDAEISDAAGDAMSCSGTCTLPNAMTSCTSGMCLLTGCLPGFADLDRTASNGCECPIGDLATSCAMATDQGTIAVGSMRMLMAVLTTPGDDQWLQITFAPHGHPKVIVTNSMGGNVRFDVMSTCTSATLTCMDRAEGATDLTTWEFYDGPHDGGVSDASTMPHDGGADGGATRMTPYPSSVYVRLFTTVAATTCLPYTVTISN